MAGPGGGSSGGGFGGGSFGGGSHGGGGFSGGSHGGGGFGGGSFGGGPHDGGFGGGPRPGPGGFGGGPHRPPHHHGPHWHGGFFGPGWHFGYGPRYGGGGGFGCLTGAIIIALFVAMFAVFMILPSGEYTFGQSEELTNAGVLYDEGTMQDYANTKYKKYFGDSEDNILLVFLTNNEADGYYTIAWVGYNIRSEINNMFGEYTEYGEALSNNINENYFAYSLDTDLATVVAEMENSIKDLGFSSSFSGDKDETTPESKFYNFTNFDLTQSVVDTALESFTKSTGIPMSIVVDSAEEVFACATEDVSEIIGSADGKTDIVLTPSSTTSRIGWFILAVAVMVAAMLILVYFVKKSVSKKKKKDDDLPWES